MQPLAVPSCFVGEVGRSDCQICQRQRPISAGQPRRRGFPAEFRSTSFSCGRYRRMAHLAEGRRFRFSGARFPGLPRECGRFSTDIRRSRQLPSPVDTFLACFVRGERRGMSIKSRGRHCAGGVLAAVVAATLPVAAVGQDPPCGTADSTLSASLKTLGSTLPPTLAAHPTGHRRCLKRTSTAGLEPVTGTVGYFHPFVSLS